jgi:hypothetical protein
MPRTLLATAAILTMVAASALAAPPPDARPASEILRAVEQRPDFRYLRELEWDEDGYWEVEYITRDGGRVELRIDPRTGQPRTRR